MKDRKLSSLIIASVVLFFIIIILFSVWGYMYFQDKNKKASTIAVLSTKQTSSTVIRDSLQKNYTAAVDKLNTSLPSIENLPDSSKKMADSNVKALYKLRDEIPALLSGESSINDLDSARIKITRLRQRIEELRTRTQKAEEENKRLNQALNQLRDQFRKGRLPNNPPANRPLSTVVDVQTITVTEARLWADDGGGGAALSTTQAKKFSGSFVVHKPKSGAAVADIYVAVIQPDGRVLKVSDWESGAFETSDGRKMYSTKISVDDFKGESRKLDFSIAGEDFQKGAYQLQLYQNGSRIGKASATLL